jgi:hypothetical protein
MKYHAGKSAQQPNSSKIKWLNFVSPEEERVKRFQQQVNSGLVSLTRPRDVRVRDTEEKTTTKVVVTQLNILETLLFSHGSRLIFRIA